MHQLESLSHITETHRHCDFAEFTHSCIRKWISMMRVINCRQDEKINLTKLENKTRTQFLPKLTGRVSPGYIERSVLELPARLGGLNIMNQETDAAHKFKDSKILCKPLVEKLSSTDTGLDGVGSSQKRVSTEIQKENERRAERKKDVVLQSVASTPYARAFELANKRGASNWLTTLPLEEHGFCLSKVGMHCACDIIGLWKMSLLTVFVEKLSRLSICGKTFLLVLFYWRLPSCSAEWSKRHNSGNVDWNLFKCWKQTKFEAVIWRAFGFENIN